MYQLDKLAIQKNMKSTNFVPVTISCGRYMRAFVGMPGIVIEKDLGMLDCEVPVLFPFPSTTDKATIDISQALSNKLHRLPPKNLVHNHRIKTIDMFAHNKLQEVAKYVKEHASITFIFSDLTGTAAFISEIPYMCTNYEYTVPFSMRKEKKVETQSFPYEFIPFVNFIDIPYCIPIFDSHKVGGIGVYCGFLYLRADDKYVIRNSLYFILSNYEDNLLYVDGTKVRTEGVVQQAALTHMLEIINSEKVPREPASVTLKKPKTLFHEEIAVEIQVTNTGKATTTNAVLYGNITSGYNAINTNATTSTFAFGGRN